MGKTLRLTKKIFALLVLTLLIHFLPKWVHFPWVRFISPTSESLFQHERMLFTSYLLYSFFEYFAVRRDLKNLTGFWMSRLLILVAMPWLMVMLYLLPQSFTGGMPSKGWEIFLAVVSSCLVWLVVVLLEKDLASIKYSKTASVVLILLFSILLVSNTVFTEKLPFYDVFAEPVPLYATALPHLKP